MVHDNVSTNRVEKELNWLISNVDQQLDDIALREAGVEIDFYWDTTHVVRIILGMAYFYDRGVFNKRLFEERSTLVAALAAAGWIGKIRLLQPHQAELLNHLNSEFQISKRELPKRAAESFLAEIGLLHLKEVEQIARLEQKDLRGLVEKYASQAERFFKAVQFIRGNWQARLVSYARGEDGTLLDLDKDEEFDLSKVIESGLFFELRKRLDRERQEKSVNNLTDALAISYLQHLVNQFVRKETKRLPRLFVPEDKLRAAIEGLVQDRGTDEDNPLFYYTGMDGKKRSVLQTADYYVFRATFNPPASLVKDGKAKARESLTNLRNAASEVLDAPEALREELLEQSQVDGRPLTKTIADLKQFLFLEEVWLKYAAATDLQQAASKYVSSMIKLSTDRRFVAKVEDVVAEMRRKLNQNASEVKRSTSLWVLLDRCAQQTRARLHEGSQGILDVFVIFGLLRFGLPGQYHDEIQDRLAGLLSEDEEIIQHNLIKVMAAHHKARNTSDERALALALSAMWVLDMDFELQRLCRDKGNRLSWGQTMYAASMYRAPQLGVDPTPFLRQLEQQYLQLPEGRQKAQSGIGLAYLFFRRWHTLGGRSFWQKQENVTEQNQKELTESLHKAIAFAKEAESVQQSDKRVKVYALNVWLYYITEAEDVEVFSAGSRELADRLRDYRDGDLWQYRFEDTLARYFYRWSLITSLPSDKADFLHMAKIHIRNAVASSYGDGLVSTFSSALLGASIPSSR